MGRESESDLMSEVREREREREIEKERERGLLTCHAGTSLLSIRVVVLVRRTLFYRVSHVQVS